MSSPCLPFPSHTCPQSSCFQDYPTPGPRNSGLAWGNCSRAQASWCESMLVLCSWVIPITFCYWCYVKADLYLLVLVKADNNKRFRICFAFNTDVAWFIDVAHFAVQLRIHQSCGKNICTTVSADDLWLKWRRQIRQSRHNESIYQGLLRLSSLPLPGIATAGVCIARAARRISAFFGSIEQLFPQRQRWRGALVCLQPTALWLPYLDFSFATIES